MSAVTQPELLGVKITPLTQRRLRQFSANRRGFWSLWVFLALFLFSLPAEFVANDRPLLIRYDGGWYFPIFREYPETTFGGDFETEADYRDGFVIDKINEKGSIIWPLIPFSYETIITDLPGPAPSPPS